MSRRKNIKIQEHVILMDDGSEINLTVPEDHDEFYQEFVQHPGRGFYYIGNWCFVDASYKGTPLQYINMSRVIGWN